MAFLAADLQRMILRGEQPHGLRLRDFLQVDFPLAWDDQRNWMAQIAGGWWLVAGGASSRTATGLHR